MWRGSISAAATVSHQRWLVYIANIHKQTNKQCIIISTACSNPPQGKSSPSMDLVVILHTQHTETGFLRSQMGQPWLLHIIWLISEAKKLDRAVKQKLKPYKQNIKISNCKYNWTSQNNYTLSILSCPMQIILSVSKKPCVDGESWKFQQGARS